ncbi:hypothetical protein SAMD00023353_10300110 [Rosellinia necatrix]|uniref:Uncharacterized protein n=1 Tax=Rosellinia necatrix TaxID=77044 RepID=A0A1S8ACA5_ROSNE|nr:hypothetical protein SAMD00023353_10300110 [Rosellinia necatrix]
MDLKEFIEVVTIIKDNAVIIFETQLGAVKPKIKLWGVCQIGQLVETTPLVSD